LAPGPELVSCLGERFARQLNEALTSQAVAITFMSRLTLAFER
jgi:hypothetical protein